ncbi:MAG TPA: hypothetical protein VN372_07190 [Methanospirillum sp.]|nr:hypothetical protein [Methanospirillum sp.]
MNFLQDLWYIQLKGYCLSFCIILSLAVFGAGVSVVSAADGWQPYEVRPWVQVEIPADWTAVTEKNETISPDSALITATSPGIRTNLKIILEHTPEIPTIEEVKSFQSTYMSGIGFRVCLTKDPIVDVAADQTSYRQTYVRGEDDAAVIGSTLIPGWGYSHYILVMKGANDVGRYYEELPPVMNEHIRPR